MVTANEGKRHQAYAESLGVDKYLLKPEMPRAKEYVSFNGKQFFEALLQIAMEGFFSDPIYGGNRDKVGWKLVGYPGLPAKYASLIEQYRNRRYSVEPRSIADVS